MNSSVLLILFPVLSIYTVSGYDWRTELKTLQNDIEDLKTEQNIFKNRLEHVELYLKNDTLDLSKSNYQRDTFRPDVTTPAFSVRLSQQVGNLGDNQVIVFDHVITNEGKNYDPITGIFKSSKAGTYVFYSSIVSVPGSYATTQIALNGHGVAWTFSLDPVNASTGETMVVIHLNAGDVVSVRMNGNHHDYRKALIAQFYCSFSGFLLN